MKKETIVQASSLLTEIEAGKFKETAVKGLEGYSGKKIIASLHALTKLFCGSKNVYLELGVFRGFTLISNAYANIQTLCYGIDNFSLFDEEEKNKSIVEGHLKRLHLKNASVIDRDFDEALDALAGHIGKKKVGVFFVDGPHDYRSQLVPLLKIVPYLAEECAIVVDDANYPHVRQATNDFLKTHPDFALLAEAYTRKHIANMNEKEKRQAINGWWDGVNIIVRDPKKTLPRTFAQEQNKHLYFSSHDVFRHEFSGIAFDILKLVQGFVDIQPSEEAKMAKKIKQLVREHRRKNPELFPHQNTYSEKLSEFVLHRKRQ